MGILRFRLFGFPVAVLPGYWLLSALLVFYMGRQSMATGVALMGVMFCSIMVHELGHAFMARAFGLPAQITLHMMGGATAFPGSAQLTRGRDVMISLAGPFAGLALGIAAGVALYAQGRDLSMVDGLPPWVPVLQYVCLINVIWSVLNLMPVIPFDGGRVLAAALGPRRRELAGSISLVVGLLLAFALFNLGSYLAAFLFGFAAVSSFMRLRQPPEEQSSVDESALAQVLTTAELALEREQFQQASQLSHQVLGATRAPETGQRALSVLLWARLGLGDARGAHGLMQSAPEGTVEPYLAAAVHEAHDDLTEARRLLTTARAKGDERVQVTALLIKVLLRQGEFATAADLTREIVARIAPDEARRVVTEARRGGAPAEAGRLSIELAKTQRSISDAIEAIFDFAVAGRGAEAKAAFRLALEFDPQAARNVLSDARLSSLRSDLEPLAAS